MITENDLEVLEKFKSFHTSKMAKYRGAIVPNWLNEEAKIISIIDKLLIESKSGLELPAIRYNCNSVLREGLSEYKFVFDFAFFAAKDTISMIKYEIYIKSLLEIGAEYKPLCSVILGNLDERYPIPDMVMYMMQQTNTSNSPYFYQVKKKVYEKIISHLLEFWDANDLNYILNEYLPFIQKELL